MRTWLPILRPTLLVGKMIRNHGRFVYTGTSSNPMAADMIVMNRFRGKAPVQRTNESEGFQLLQKIRCCSWKQKKKGATSRRCNKEETFGTSMAENEIDENTISDDQYILAKKPNVFNYTSSASNAIFEINKLRKQLQGKDDTIRSFDAQISIMKVLNTKRLTRQPTKVRKPIKRVWKPISKNVANTKPQWKPTGRHFLLYEMYPLTRITESTDKPIELPPSASSSPKITMVSRFTDHKLSDDRQGSKGISWIFLDLLSNTVPSGHPIPTMPVICAATYQLVEKFIGTVRLGHRCSHSELVKDREPPSVPPMKKQVDDLFQWFDDDEVILPPVVPIPPVNVHAASAPENANDTSDSDVEYMFDHVDSNGVCIIIIAPETDSKEYYSNSVKIDVTPKQPISSRAKVDSSTSDGKQLLGI
ncbi:hypothetical protein Tco_0169447 [Tanacetum coccineum]